MKRIALYFFVSCLWIGNARAQNNTTIAVCPKDSVLKWMKGLDVPGVAIGIIEDGKVKSVNVYGNVSADQYWNVASLTKPVTALTVLSLVNKELWSLDEPVARYWVDPDIKDNAWKDKLTTRILLSHQSGFANWRFFDSSKKLSFHFEPGTRMRYSGEGFEYLRRAVEAKFGKTLQQLADEQVFAPLQMTHTRYSWSDQLAASAFVGGYDQVGKIYPVTLNHEVNAADWLVTTITDYTRLGAYVVNGSGLSRSSWDEMTALQSHFDTTQANKANGMGLGWQVIRDLPNGEFALAHSGSDPGIATFVLLFPVSKRGIVLFTNGDNGGALRCFILQASGIDLAPALAKYMGEFRPNPVVMKGAYSFDLPRGWRMERTRFPPPFAPQVKLHGIEEIRFPPGWGSAGRPDYWSVAYLFWLDSGQMINESILKDNIRSYYDGLVITGGGPVPHNIPKDKMVETKVDIQKIKAEPGDQQTYTGTVYMLDYMQMKPITLNYRVHVKSCSDKQHFPVFLELSPQPFNNEIWYDLEKMQKNFSCEENAK